MTNNYIEVVNFSTKKVVLPERLIKAKNLTYSTSFNNKLRAKSL